VPRGFPVAHSNIQKVEHFLLELGSSYDSAFFSGKEPINTSNVDSSMASKVSFKIV